MRDFVLHPRFEAVAARIDRQTAWIGAKRVAAAMAAAGDGATVADVYSVVHTVKEDGELLRDYYTEAVTALVGALTGYNAVLTAEGDIIVQVASAWDAAQRVRDIMLTMLADYVMSKWYQMLGDTDAAATAAQAAASDTEQLLSALSARRRPTEPVYNSEGEIQNKRYEREW